MPDLDALIAELETAEGPSNVLDFQIAMAIFPGDVPDTTRVKNIKFTSSIDAALTLVEEGAEWILNNSTGIEQRFYAVVAGPVVDGTEGLGITPALALCIAALKARKESGDG